jgi:hypothetical protein
MNTQSTIQQKPTLVHVIAWMTLASGILNLLWGFGLALTALLSIVGVVCLPFAILPTVLGVFELIYAAKLMSNPPQAVQPSTAIAILEIICVLVGNLFSVVVGILALVFYSDSTVRDYFARLNGEMAPVAAEPLVPPVVPEVPASVSEPEPVVPDEIIPPDQPEPPLPGEETPQG